MKPDPTDSDLFPILCSVLSWEPGYIIAREPVIFAASTDRRSLRFLFPRAHRDPSSPDCGTPPPRAPESTPRRRPNMSASNKTLVFDPSKAGESNVPRILGLGITFHVLALVAFGLRMYTRAVIVRSFGKDDVLMILCMVCRPLCHVLSVSALSCHASGGG